MLDKNAPAFRLPLLALLLGLSLSACATVEDPKADAVPAAEAYDPLEPVNRSVFEFNRVLDGMFLRPLAGLYRVIIPPPVRDLVSGILNNMAEPVNMLNFALQGEFGSAGNTLGRFLVNTTFGVGGMFDPARQLGLKEHDTDFGETLHVWGAGEGPYLVLPLLGPSNARDAVGFGVDSLASPWGYIVELGPDTTETQYMASNLGATFLTRRAATIEALDNLEEGSLDFYATMRSVYRQFRNNRLGVEAKVDESLYQDLEDETSPANAPNSGAPVQEPGKL